MKYLISVRVALGWLPQSLDQNLLRNWQFAPNIDNIGRYQQVLSGYTDFKLSLGFKEFWCFKIKFHQSSVKHFTKTGFSFETKKPIKITFVQCIPILIKCLNFTVIDSFKCLKCKFKRLLVHTPN